MADELFHAPNERQRFKMARGKQYGDVINFSKAGKTYASRSGGDHPTSVTAFNGFVPFYENAHDAVVNSNSSKLRWAEQLLRGITHDDEELCAVAMKHDHSDFKVTVKQKGKGAPYSFHSAGFFTEEQMDENTQMLKSHIENRVKKAQLFVSANEWKEIHQWIDTVGRYGDPKLNKVVKGDSSLMIAVRLSSFKAAKYLLKMNVDPAIINEHNDSIAEVIKSKYDDIVEERNRIRFLRTQARGVRQMNLSPEEKLVLLSEPQVYDKMEQCYNLCVELSARFEVRLYNMVALKMKEKVLQVENISLSEKEVAELAQETTIAEGKKIIDGVINEAKNVVEEWEGTKLGKERARKQAELDAKITKEKKLNAWRKEFNDSARKIQSVVRGVACRSRLHLLYLHRGCIFVQSHTRGFLGRRAVRKIWLLECVQLISKVGRGFIGRKRVAKMRGRDYPDKQFIITMQESTVKIPLGGDLEGQQIAEEFDQQEAGEIMLGEVNVPKSATASAPKGQWATLRFLGQRMKLEEIKQDVLNDRKDSEKLAKLGGICLEHALGGSLYIPEVNKLEFCLNSASCFVRASRMGGWDATGSDLKRKGTSLLNSFRMCGFENSHSYLIEAKSAFEQALSSLEITVDPEVWWNLALVNEYLGDIEGSLKTCGSIVRKFPKYGKLSSVCMKSAYMHIKLGVYDVALSYLKEAKNGGYGGECELYSSMDMIMIGGRINELWSINGNKGEQEVGDDDDEEVIREGKKLIAEKAYKTVFRHYLQHSNTYGTRNYNDWINNPNTWIRVAVRASKSGDYMLAEELWTVALDRSGFDYANRVLGFDVEKWLAKDNCLGGKNVVRILFEIGKCCWFRYNGLEGDDENEGKDDALKWLRRAEDAERRFGRGDKEQSLKIARAVWGAKKSKNRLDSDSKMPIPKLIIGIPRL